MVVMRMRNNQSTKSPEKKTSAPKKKASKAQTKKSPAKQKFQTSELVLNSPAYQYCKQAVRLKTTPKYVKKQMRAWMPIVEGKNPKYKVSEKKLKQVEALLKILKMPKGLKAGQSLFECSTKYQWLIYVAVICTVHRDNPSKRKYEINVDEICRKNFKTYTVATLFILLFFTEPKFSRFFSVAPDGSLSREIREAIAETIKSSPIIREFKGKQRFKILRDYIYCNTTEIKYEPLAYSTSRMDGKLPNAFCADEVGALPNSYAIEAMRSGQLNILNKLGFIISTKYPTLNNPFEDWVDYAKKVLDGLIEDETIFALLYEPDNPKNWMTDDLVLQQANPVALESPEIWADLLKKRAYAIAVESARENFCCKHCNIIYSGAGTETYVDVAKLQSCKVSEIDWKNRVVYVGLDLSESNDNTSVSILAVDENNHILADSYAFIPEGRIDEKMSTEHVNYRELLNTGKVIACGDSVIDYAVVEDFILSIEERMGVRIQAVGYDRWNALSTAQKLERAGLVTVEIRQHSSVLHPPTKLLKEKILNGEFEYTENRLYEINFQNARCTYDTNKNQYVNKKKSTGKVDMTVSTINAMFLVQQDCFFNQSDFTIQVF
jgi:phage terminase large subunit-like protein